MKNTILFLLSFFILVTCDQAQESSSSKVTHPDPVYYTITFNKNSNEAEGSMTPLIDIQEGDSVKLDPCSFSNENFFFLGWSTVPGDNNEVEYVKEAEFLMGADNLDLYGVWSEKGKYNIFFNKNHDGVEGDMLPQTDILEKDTVNLDPLNFSNDGLVFLGWATTQTEGGVLYEDKDELIMGKNNVELFARWESLQVTRDELNTMISELKDVRFVDTSEITDMSELFKNNKSFNQDISRWDLSKVTNMSGMFHYAESFNQDIGDWDVSNVTDMSYLFTYAKNFNQDISRWDCREGVNLRSALYGASSFDNKGQPLPWL